MMLDKVFPKSLRRRVMAQVTRMSRWPPLGRVNFGDLRRLTPISKDWGYDRGTPIDRYYIERFLSGHTEDISGRVLEVGTDAYTKQFGGDNVTQSEVLHVSDHLPGVTLIADLMKPDCLAGEMFDSVILTQTLQFIYDPRAALSTVHRILNPDGVLLVTVPGIAQISRADMDRWGDYWRFTSLAVERMLEEIFPEAHCSVGAYGNVLSAVAFLEGVATEELLPAELDHQDPDWEVVVAGRVKRNGSGG